MSQAFYNILNYFLFIHVYDILFVFFCFYMSSISIPFMVTPDFDKEYHNYSTNAWFQKCKIDNVSTPVAKVRLKIGHNA